MNRAKWIAWLVVFPVALAVFSSAGWCSNVQRDEERLGKEYAAEVEKSATLVTDKAQLERVQRIGNALAEIANKMEVPARYGSSEVCKFDYKFKVIEDKDVNAFSLPGGRIYVNTGLLEMVESDDELAGVLAHEIAHASHHHMTQLLRKQSSVDKYVALVALAGILGNVRGSDLNNLLMGAQMIKVGKLSGYTMEAERDADRTAVAYMAKSNYNSEGLLTFMRRLEEKHSSEPTVPLGIFQTHPAPYKRVAAVARAMEAEGMKIDMRRLRDVAYAKATPITDGSDRYQVVVSKKVIFAPAGMGSGPSSKERADQIAKAVNDALDAHISSQDLSEDYARKCLMARQSPVLQVEAEDAGTSEEARALLEKARAALEYAVWADWLCNSCPLAQDDPLDE